MSEVHTFRVRNSLSNLPSCRICVGSAESCRFVGTIVYVYGVGYLAFSNYQVKWLPRCDSAREALDLLLAAS